MRDAIYEMSAKKLGITAVVDAEGRLLGCISDGDLRRLLERDDGACCAAPPASACTAARAPSPATSWPSAALNEMEEHRITSLFVCDAAGRLEGIVHLHDLWRLELF